MATLIAGLKGRLRASLLDSVAKRKRESVARMIVLLRLAVILKHVEALEKSGPRCLRRPAISHPELP